MSNHNHTRDKQILEQYAANVDISILCTTFNLSRVSIYNVLKKHGIKPARKSESPVTPAVCAYCTIDFMTPTSQPRQYCSCRCFAKARSFNKETDGSMSRHYGRLAKKELERRGVSLLEGQVIHHKDGDKSNNFFDNLQVFDSHNDHMKYHHSLISH